MFDWLFWPKFSVTFCAFKYNNKYNTWKDSIIWKRVVIRLCILLEKIQDFLFSISHHLSIFSLSLHRVGRSCQAWIWNYLHSFLILSIQPWNAAWCLSPGPLAEPWKPDVICLGLNIQWEGALILQGLHPALACLYLLFTLDQIKNTSAANCKHPIWYWFYTSHWVECTSSSRCWTWKLRQLADDKQTAIAWRCTSSFPCRSFWRPAPI